MPDASVRVYCAGPLFNKKEKEEMQELACALEDQGFEVFLPQRDGLELTRCVDTLVKAGTSREVAGKLLSRAIFALDVYQVIERCDAIVANLNGRVPDEGAVSEAAMAWCCGKTLIGYKSDMRSVFLGQDNPLVTGLFNFTLVSEIEDVPVRLSEMLPNPTLVDRKAEARKEEMREHLELGGKIWKAMEAKESIDNVAKLLLSEKNRVGNLGT